MRVAFEEHVPYGKRPCDATRPRAGGGFTIIAPNDASPRAPYRVVILLQDLLFGGTQRHALELAGRLDRERFAPEIWTMAGGEDFLPRAREYGLSVTHLAPKGPVGPRALFALWKRLGAGGVDLLLPMTVVPNIWGRVFGRLCKVPLIVGNCRGIGDLPRQHESVLKNLADHHLCNAEAIRERLISRYALPPDRVATIRNGVDAAYYRPPDGPARSAATNILCAARMVAEKDHPTLAKAFAKTLARHPEATLTLVGDGPLLPGLRRLIGELGIEERVRICGGTSDLRPYFSEASVFVLSSTHEGLPNVVLEAMASGLPVAATAAGGVPELVEDGRTGFLSPIGDADALSRSLDRLLSAPPLAREMGEKGRERVLAHFSQEAMVRRHEEIFLRLLTASKNRE